MIEIEDGVTVIYKQMSLVEWELSENRVVILRPVLFCARNIVVVLLVVLGSHVEYIIMECSVRLKWISKMDFVINERILDNGMSMPMLEKELNTISEKSRMNHHYVQIFVSLST